MQNIGKGWAASAKAQLTSLPSAHPLVVLSALALTVGTLGRTLIYRRYVLPSLKDATHVGLTVAVPGDDPPASPDGRARRARRRADSGTSASPLASAAAIRPSISFSLDDPEVSDAEGVADEEAVALVLDELVAQRREIGFDDVSPTPGPWYTPGPVGVGDEWILPEGMDREQAAGLGLSAIRSLSSSAIAHDALGCTVAGRQDALAAIRAENMGPLAALLASDPLLAALAPEELSALVAAGTFETFEPGESVWSIGDPDEDLCLMLSGSIVISSGGELLRTASAGEIITSIMSVLEALAGVPSVFKTITARADATDGASLLRIPAAAFRAVTESNASVLPQLLEVILLKLSKVTFLTMYAYLGLTTELVAPQLPGESGPETKAEFGDESVADAPGDSRDDNDDDQSVASSAASSEAALIFDDVAVQLAEALGIAPDSEAARDLKRNLVLKQAGPGKVVLKRGSNETELCLIVSGSLTVCMVSLEGAHVELYSAERGELCGQLAVLTREPSLVHAYTRDGCVVAMVSRSLFWSLVDTAPTVLQHLAVDVLRRLSPLVRCLDFALDWIHVRSGQWLYTHGEPADAIYIVLSGRMRSVPAGEEATRDAVAMEHGRGESLGELEMLAGVKRTKAAMAIRDAQLVRIRKETFAFICARFPVLALRFAGRMSRLALAAVDDDAAPEPLAAAPTPGKPLGAHALPRPDQANVVGRTNSVKTIAVVPLDHGVAGPEFVANFASELERVLVRCGHAPTNGKGVAVLDAASVSSLGTVARMASPHAREVALMDALSRLEDAHEFVLYRTSVVGSRTEPSEQEWLLRAFRQADVVLFVGSTGPTQIRFAERMFEELALSSRSELVLIHPPATVLPRGTREWLDARPWIDAHHHCRKGNGVHMGRLARRVTGTALGLVLGGGGAKGLSHLGMLKELETRGSVVDVLGGTSIGACIGALYAQEESAAAALRRLEPFNAHMASKWRKLFDLTYPATAIFTGRAFNRGLIALLGPDADITDLWIPFFCVSTDLTKGRVRIHTEGVQWRYVRASMTLTGYLPPMCDPVDGCTLLCDGGYVNNCPADILINLHAPGRVIAIDVGAKDTSEVTFYGDELSGWWVLWKRWFPFTQPAAIPSMQEISSSLAYVTGRVHLEDHVIGAAHGRLQYYAPPIQGFATLDFDRADEIYQVGLEYAQQQGPEFS
ncbi:PNPLA7 protein [Thecamonas trahens ATCC 50062]|uniref:PNPLA7 protein n=1 Tax=Thecamonas trahens ATCC 50062 TaxID=461836 RepID=A0A0L0DHS8_THETB|nr:PNPLA7 protein [Thecamonas trahens ATCC 50062]KNC51780.1 PNPLA7 protein [Thecamonas trahens ATCC 50062]|eukprot:XP_013755653.1 PNPLA7 protein [Thecamonas trahens ATCC 50062]